MDFSVKNTKHLNEIKILEETEKLLLENNQEIVIDELASALEVAKGTIYNYFKSKNEIYLELLIMNENRLLSITKNYSGNIQNAISEYMLYHLQNANRTVILHNIEEKITLSERGLNQKFKKLYAIREQRILEVKKSIIIFLKNCNSLISVSDYLSYIWTVTHGACLLLSSSYYQKSLSKRSKLIHFYISKVLNV